MVASVVQFFNCAPTSAVSHETPYEAYFFCKPSMAHLCIFGCNTYTFVPKKERLKFDAKSQKFLLVGYNSIFASYHLYDPVTHRVEQSRDVIFDESSILKAALCLPLEGADPPISLDPSTFGVPLADFDPLAIPSNDTFLPNLPPIPSSLLLVHLESSSLATSLQLPIEEDNFHDDIVQEDLLELELQQIPKWLIQILKDSGVGDHASWNKFGPHSYSHT